LGGALAVKGQTVGPKRRKFVFGNNRLDARNSKPLGAAAFSFTKWIVPAGRARMR